MMNSIAQIQALLRPIYLAAFLLMAGWLWASQAQAQTCEDICKVDRRQMHIFMKNHLDFWRSCISRGMDPCLEHRNKGGYSINTGGRGNTMMGELVGPFSAPPPNAIRPVEPGTGTNELNMGDFFAQLGGLPGGGALFGGGLRPGGGGGGNGLGGFFGGLRINIPVFNLDLDGFIFNCGSLLQMARIPRALYGVCDGRISLGGVTFRFF